MTHDHQKHVTHDEHDKDTVNHVNATTQSHGCHVPCDSQNGLILPRPSLTPHPDPHLTPIPSVTCYLLQSRIRSRTA
jgi:hypothetical protein